MCLLRQRKINGAHDGRMLREDIDKPIFLQPEEGIANRGRAEAELLLEREPVQDGSRG